MLMFEKWYFTYVYHEILKIVELNCKIYLYQLLPVYLTGGSVVVLSSSRQIQKQLGNSTPYPVGLEASGDLRTPYRSLNQPKSKVHVTHRNDTQITTVFSQNSLPYLAFSDSARFDCVDITRLYMALTVVLVCIFGVEYLNIITINSDVIMSAIASRLFVQPFVQAQITENVKALRHWPLWGESTSNRWIPLTKDQSRGKCFHLMTSSYGSEHYQICASINS